jgi:hypothetical protein
VQGVAVIARDSCLGLLLRPHGGGAAGALRDPERGALALDVAVDAGHPRVDLVHQQPLAQPLDVVGPVGDAGGGSLDDRMRYVRLFQKVISSAQSFTFTDARASSRWCILVAPTIGAVITGLASNHASAT